VRNEWLEGENVTIVLNKDLNSSFFFIEDRPDGGIDPIRKFVHENEANIRQLYHHLLYRPGCARRDLKSLWGGICAPEQTKRDRRDRIVIDVGANRGYYVLLAAAYGYKVHGFDPQPHCINMLGMEVILNGFTPLIDLHHKYVSNEIKNSMRIRRRTGKRRT